MSGMDWWGVTMSFLVIYLMYRDFQVQWKMKFWIEAIGERCRKWNEDSEKLGREIGEGVRDYVDKRVNAHVAVCHEFSTGNPVEDFDDDDFEEDDSGSYSGELDDEDEDDDDTPGGKEDFGG